MKHSAFIPISIIIPTYNEKKNLNILIPQIHQKLKPQNIIPEIIIIDDNSSDNPSELHSTIGKTYKFHLIIRKKHRSLAQSVMLGIKLAHNNICVVMDADASHQIADIPRLIAPLITQKAHISIGSRFLKNSQIINWPWHRYITSKIARLLASPLTSISDSTSGFFAIKKNILSQLQLTPISWKIMLEIIVKLQKTQSSFKIIEIPIIFLNRQFGKSKANLIQALLYLIHLLKLYFYQFTH